MLANKTTMTQKEFPLSIFEMIRERNKYLSQWWPWKYYWCNKISLDFI